MKKLLPVLLSLILFLSLGATNDLPWLDRAWSTQRLWFDGRAEVAEYRAERKVYDVARICKLILITVKEDFDADLLVKADEPFGKKKLIPVMKLNVNQVIPTENYDYHYMTSIFTALENPWKLIKIANSSQEWCGTTYKELKRQSNGSYLYSTFSYFEGQGDRSSQIKFGADHLLEEQLFLALRSLNFEKGLRIPIRLGDLLITNDGGDFKFSPAEILVSGKERRRSVGCWKVEVRKKGFLYQTYWLRDSSPYPIQAMESVDGRKMELQKISRRRYWIPGE